MTIMIGFDNEREYFPKRVKNYTRVTQKSLFARGKMLNTEK